MTTAKIEPRIFRAYDIRGVAYSQLSADACRLIGQAFGSVLRERTSKEHPVLCLGRDARTHGPKLQQAVLEGLMKAGCYVLLIGETPSPVNYFTICARKLDGGVQVTASHNPAQDNGLKLSVTDAEAFSGDDLQILRQRIDEGNLLEGEGSCEEIDALTPYIDHVSAMFKGIGKGLKVAVDSGNGVSGPAYCKVLKHIGAEVSELYTEPDGTFPHHLADPSKLETLEELQKLITDEKVDIGFAFDGDGDRLGLVDETGTVKSADHILLLLAQDVLKRHAGSPVVFTVSNSSILETEVTSLGGKPVMAKVGHSFVEHAMRQHSALLGGEQSGHFFCGEGYFAFDDALVAALRVLSILHEKGRPLSKAFAAFPTVYQAPELRPFCADDAKAGIIADVTAHFQKHYPVTTLDGARIDFGEGAWAGIRQSNTSPCLSICMEARSPEKLEEMKKDVMDVMQKYPEVKF